MEVSQSPGREACRVKARSEKNARTGFSRTAVVTVEGTGNHTTPVKWFFLLRICLARSAASRTRNALERTILPESRETLRSCHLERSASRHPCSHNHLKRVVERSRGW